MIEKTVLDNFQHLLDEFKSLPHDIESESIFDIAGYPHYENVCSNILAFYLNPNNEHGLGNLLFRSLLNLAGNGNITNHDNFQINREVWTNKGGRLDLVIETDNQIIGIENKIFHFLNNDLNDYSKSIDMWAKNKPLEPVKIVLSMKKEPASHGFVCITYEKYWSEIKEHLGDYVSTSSQKWLLYLVDFMSSIEKLKGKNMELDKNDEFYIKNDETIQRLLDGRNKFIAKLKKKVSDFLEIIEQKEKPKGCTKRWIYAGSCLVHDFKLSDHEIAFDLAISSKGWELQLFGRNRDSNSYLLELFSIFPLNEHNVKMKENRHILSQHELDTSFDDIEKDLLNWMKLLVKSEHNIKLKDNLS